jgi:hypothetical protein
MGNEALLAFDTTVKYKENLLHANKDLKNVLEVRGFQFLLGEGLSSLSDASS